MNWFTDPNKKNLIETYNKLLKNISELDSVKNTCNLYDYLHNEFEKNLYTDGVHLSNSGHRLWAQKIYLCLDLKNQL